MNLDLRYLGRSELRGTGSGPGAFALSFSPNLVRNKVFFDAELVDPVRFREAMSALHDVVIGDLRQPKKDRTAYLAWKEEQEKQESDLRRSAAKQGEKNALALLGNDAPPPGLEADFRRMHGIYWRARRTWASELSREDPAMFRALVPCDPVVTVAPDAVLFECFSKDESSYGCLTVDRGSFRGDQGAGLGTTNVDYSLALFDHFQSLRSYRSTRFVVDPSGFEVKIGDAGDVREEKIDLPNTWLRGFGQLSAAMALPHRKITLPVGAVYSILAHLKRHREKTGPRSLRFVLSPGKTPEIVLDPWNVRIDATGATDSGTRAEEIKIWGRRRLMALARVLPLADKVEVRLLGSGLPSIWVAHLGDMRFTLALSGWTANDWTGGASLEMLAGDVDPDENLVSLVEAELASVRLASISAIARAARASSDAVLPALHVLAKRGQVMYDFAAQNYRYRPVMPVALSESVLGPEPLEVREGRRLAREGAVSVERDEQVSPTRRLLVGKVQGANFEALVDLDGGLSRAKCSCSHFHAHGLKAGPCRHLLATRLWVSGTREKRKLH